MAFQIEIMQDDDTNRGAFENRMKDNDAKRVAFHIKIMHDNDVNTEAFQNRIIWDRKMQHRRIWDKSGKAWIEWISSRTPAITNKCIYLMKHIFERGPHTPVCKYWCCIGGQICAEFGKLARGSVVFLEVVLWHFLALPSAEHSLNAIPSSAIGLDFGKQNNSTIPDCQNCFQSFLNEVIYRLTC